MKWRALAAVGVVVLVWGAGGCGSGTGAAPSEAVVDSPSSSQSPVESAELLAALASGEVGYDDYLAGFQRFAACLSAEGHEVLILDDSGPLVRYSITEAAMMSGADEACYAREFGPLDAEWQIANADTSEWAVALRECLADRGLEPAGTLVEMEQQMADAGITVEECVLG